LKDFAVIPPKQKYMTLAEIRATYGSRGVVAYSCKVMDSVPQGGFVIAVQKRTSTDSNMLKEYMRQFKKQYPNKKLVYYFRFEETEADAPLSFVYDNGAGEVKGLSKIEVKKHKGQTMMETMPDELLAQVLMTSLRKDE